MWMLRRIALVAAIVGFLPVALAGLAFALSWALECPVTENGIRACLLLGFDMSGLIGGLLTVSIPSAVLLTVPACITVVGWALIEVVNLIRNGRFD